MCNCLIDKIIDAINEMPSMETSGHFHLVDRETVIEIIKLIGRQNWII